MRRIGDANAKIANASSPNIANKSPSRPKNRTHFSLRGPKSICAAVDGSIADYEVAGKVNYLRTLFGRLRECLGANDVALMLHVKPTDVENYGRHAKKALSKRLYRSVR